MKASFFNVPTKLHHALLVATTLAEHHASGSVLSLTELAASTGASQGYLEEVAAGLRQAGLIVGQRGIGGGYRLAVDPASITVADVVEAIEGKMAMVDCLAGAEHCGMSASCNNRSVWDRIQTRVLDSMRSITVAEAAGIKNGVTAKA
jgi:Rrf2 family protein